MTMTDQELYQLCKDTKVRLHRITGNLEVDASTPPELVEQLRTHKAEIVDAMSGYCFSHDVAFCDRLHSWKIFKVSSIPDVYYTPIIVFSGTAAEVDAWAKEHKDDPFFTDRYTSKYSFARCNEE